MYAPVFANDFCPRRLSPTKKLVCWFDIGIPKHDVKVNHSSDESKEMDKAIHKMLSSSGKVRSAIMCKPRCVYSETTLKGEEKQKLTELEEDYTSGSILLPPASPYR